MNLRNILSLSFIFLVVFGYAQPSEDKLNDASKKLPSTYGERAKEMLNGEEYKSLTYEEAYKKLLELYTKNEESKAVQKFGDLGSVFIKKMNMDYQEMYELKDSIISLLKMNPDKKEKSEELNFTLLGWVTENLEKTYFSSLEEATKDHEELMTAYHWQYVGREEYYVFMFMAIHKFGSEIFADIVYDYTINNPNSLLNKTLRER